MAKTIKTDGNGSLIIPKGALVLLSVMIALFTLIASVVAYQVTIKKDVEFLKEGDYENRINNLEKTIPVIDLRLKNIEENVEKIVKRYESIED